MPENIVIVNDSDEAIGVKERETLSVEDIYRVSALWIENGKGQVLLAKRALTKKKDPGLWGPAVAGTVDAGESYKKNIIREAKEELGITIEDLKEIGKQRVKKPHNHFTKWYLLTLDKPLNFFKVQEEEVDEINWFDKKELIKMIERDSPNLIASLKVPFILNMIKQNA